MLYILQCNDFYKIGITTNLKARVAELQCGNPYKLNLIGSFDVPDNFEWRVHKFLKDAGRNVGGEWFSLTVDDVAELKKKCKLREQIHHEQKVSNPCPVQYW